jgi:hypothetical protein
MPPVLAFNMAARTSSPSDAVDGGTRYLNLYHDITCSGYFFSQSASSSSHTLRKGTERREQEDRTGPVHCDCLAQPQTCCHNVHTTSIRAGSQRAGQGRNARELLLRFPARPAAGGATATAAIRPRSSVAAATARIL